MKKICQQSGIIFKGVRLEKGDIVEILETDNLGIYAGMFVDEKKEQPEFESKKKVSRRK